MGAGGENGLSRYISLNNSEGISSYGLYELEALF